MAEQQVYATEATLSGHVAALKAQIAAGQATIAQAVSNAEAALAVTRTKIGADVGNAKQRVQASTQEAVGDVQSTLNTANSDYAQLLAVVQIADAHKLPDGDATGANVQHGAYVYRVAGTN
jgi:hypothetical protein